MERFTIDGDAFLALVVLANEAVTKFDELNDRQYGKLLRQLQEATQAAISDAVTEEE